MARSRDFNPAAANWLVRSYYTPVSDALRGHLSGRLGWRYTVAAFGLPYELSGVVVEVVRRTRLSRAELNDVARELCTHFSDGLASGAKPEVLIKDFGDPAATAALIRRSKLRGRPLHRRLARHASQLLLALLIFLPLCYGLLAARFYLARPTVAHNYWNEINDARHVEAADRAWPLYREALQDLGPKDGDFLMQNSDEPVGGPRWPELVATLERHSKALQLAREAAQKPRLGYLLGDPEDRAAAIIAQNDWATDSKSALADENQPLIEALLPGIQNLRALSWTLIVDARRAAAVGDSATALADLGTLLSLSKQMAPPGALLVEQLIAFHIFEQTLRTIDRILVDSPDRFTESELRDLTHRLAAKWGGAITIDFSAERLAFDDILQRGFTDNGNGDGRLTPAGLKLLDGLDIPSNDPGPNRAIDSILSPGLSAVVGSRRENRELFNSLVDEAIAAHQGPAWRWNRDVAKGIDLRLQALMASPTDRIRYFLVGFFVPALQPIFNVAEQTTQHRDATQAAIALVLWHRQHGHWPESLAALVPSLLPAIPVDRFDGQPLRYRVVDGKPLLYSIGEDRVDDGGQPAAEIWRYFDSRPDWFDDHAQRRGWEKGGDWVLWPAPPVASPAESAPSEESAAADSAPE